MLVIIAADLVLVVVQETAMASVIVLVQLLAVEAVMAVPMLAMDALMDAVLTVTTNV